MAIIDNFDNTISKDLYNLCFGKTLGSGLGRDVFEWLPDRSLVAKVEGTAKSFQNIIEWETWQSVKDVIDIHKWFAPCHEISPCGTILLQQITTAPAKYPDKIPAFFTDTKRQNFGMINKQFVCHDYGVHLMLENGMTKRMRKAKWWDE